MKDAEETVVNLLSQVELHDLPVKRMEMNFDKNSVLFEFCEWDDLNNRYKNFTLHFLDIHKFITSEDGSESFKKEGIEIVDYEYEQLEDALHQTKLSFYMDTGAVWNVIIVFERLELRR